MDFLHVQLQTKAPRTPLPVDILVPGAEEVGPHRLLILLHDFGGNNTTWLRRTKVEEAVEGTNTIVIMPSCLNSFYADMYFGYDMLTYVGEELVELAKGWFDVSEDPADHMICGVGMGGYGAVLAALRYPGIFGAAASLDGWLDPSRFYDEPLRTVDMNDVFGTKETFEKSDYRLANAAASCAKKAAEGEIKALPEVGVYLSAQAPENACNEASELLTALRESGFTVKCGKKTPEEAAEALVGKEERHG